MNISAVCNETQIDINSASAEELDLLTGVGSAIAQNIINSRTFYTIDDLVKVSGIAEKKLTEIKKQGLACVNEETENTEEEKEENNSAEEEAEVIEDEKIEETENLVYENFSQVKTELEPINLNSKNIKSEDNNSNLKRNLALSGIVTFCVIFGALFLFKNRKYKNEFR